MIATIPCRLTATALLTMDSGAYRGRNVPIVVGRGGSLFPAYGALRNAACVQFARLHHFDCPCAGATGKNARRGRGS
ncbi:hypothetical protein AGR2A_Cc140042 [Agrobacterium genomosp. 2 str. CFBP 5494]|uniref:Uncharacterized protein n=1 Tax=Agrobacterium genomosp. 2 str. CFBP 5494 TaxID=1183436 RepID=A0A9W5AZG2_9HYPH|nr:hypothetical protein AGR2A_Cc140042 [Agrobacterium genomosp. 2 str. CFBP 5494]